MLRCVVDFEFLNITSYFYALIPTKMYLNKLELLMAPTTECTEPLYVLLHTDPVITLTPW